MKSKTGEDNLTSSSKTRLNEWVAESSLLPPATGKAAKLRSMHLHLSNPESCQAVVRHPSSASVPKQLRALKYVVKGS
jgi:hypothetical protein